MNELEQQAEIERLRAENAKLKRYVRGGFFIRGSRMFCLVLGSILLIVSIVSAIHTKLLLHKGIYVSGTIVDQKLDEDGTRYPIFTFVTTVGKTYTVTSNVGSNPPAYAIGQRVQVLYEVDSPDGARLAYTGQLWGIPLGFGAFGMFFASLGYFLMRRAKRRTLG